MFHIVQYFLHLPSATANETFCQLISNKTSIMTDTGSAEADSGALQLRAVLEEHQKSQQSITFCGKHYYCHL